MSVVLFVPEARTMHTQDMLEHGFSYCKSAAAELVSPHMSEVSLRMDVTFLSHAERILRGRALGIHAQMVGSHAGSLF